MSSIYDDSVLIQVPSGYGVGKLYSVIPNTPVGDFDVTRSSWTTRVNKYGYIENVVANVPRLNYDSGVVCPYLLTESASTNLLTYPISFGNPYWTKSGAGIIGDETNKTTVYSSDFSAGVDGISSTRVTSSGNNDGISDGATSYDDVLKSYASVDNATHYIYKAGMITTNVIQKISWKMYIPSANTNVNDLRITNGGSVFHYLKSSVKKVIDGTDLGAYIAAGGYITGTEGFWVEVILWVEEQSAAGTHIRWQLAKDAAETFVGAGSSADDIIYFRDFLVEDVGGFEAPKEIPTVASDLLSGWDFTSGWTAWLSATIDDNNSFTTTSNGSVYKSYLTVGTYYQIRIAGTTTTSALRLTNSVASGQYGSDINGTFDETIYFQAYINGGLGLYHAGAGTTDITTLEVKEVTSWSGGGLEREAYKLVEDVSTGAHLLSKANIAVTSGATVTTTIFAKAGERDYILLYNSNILGGRYFDLANGTLLGADGTPPNSTITPLANGWYKCTITGTVASTFANVNVYLSDDGTSTTYTGDGTSGLYLAYAQLEENGYASSLMLPVTEGSTTTRVGDVVNNAGNSALFSDVNSGGVLFFEGSFNTAIGAQCVAMHDNTTNNVIQFYSSGTLTNRLYIVIEVNNTPVMASTVLSIDDIRDNFKIAIAYKSGDCKVYLNGVEELTSSTTFSASSFNELAFAQFNDINPFYGKTKALAVFDYLSDDQMVKLTEEGYDTFNALATANNFIIR